MRKHSVEWPRFESRFLQNVAKRFDRLMRSLNDRVRLKEVGGGPNCDDFDADWKELITAHFVLWDVPPTGVVFEMFDNLSYHLKVYQAHPPEVAITTMNWRFHLEIEGKLRSVSPADIASALQETFSLAVENNRTNRVVDEIAGVWRQLE